MRIADKLAERQTFSFEIFPPKGELPLEEAYAIAEEMAGDRPDWISVTYSAGGSGNSGNTVPIAASIERDLGVTALAHLTCLGSRRADVDGYVAQLAEAGIDNVLALRGDRAPGREAIDFAHASDLISYLRSTDADLCIGAACYPEGHVESPTEQESFESLYKKQEAGADYLVSQLFFDNEDFYRFRACAIACACPSSRASCRSRASSRFSAWRSPVAPPSRRRWSSAWFLLGTIRPTRRVPAWSMPASSWRTSPPTASTACTSTA